MIMVYYKECSILKLFTFKPGDAVFFRGLFRSWWADSFWFLVFEHCVIALLFSQRLISCVFTESLSCHSAGVVVEEGVVAVVLTEVVVVEADLEGVEVVAEVDLTDIKTLVHRNMLSVRCLCFLSRFSFHLRLHCKTTWTIIIGIHALRVSDLGEFMHPCEDEIICKCATNDNKVPYFNAPVYLENKEQIGKVDEIFGQIREFVSLTLHAIAWDQCCQMSQRLQMLYTISIIKS